jgi:tyrosine-protein phosphatase SIW14
MKTFSLRLAVICVLASGAAFAADVQGVGNFHQINEHLYRGAQPSNDGFQNLAKLGIKTVIDLREAGSRVAVEKAQVEKAGMRYISIPFSGFAAPSDEQVSQVLALFDDAAAGPVFVHCRRGADRTGTVIACYRMRHDHWNNRDALAEAKADGMSWLERGMQGYVLAYKVPAVSPTNTVIAAAN